MNTEQKILQVIADHLSVSIDDIDRQAQLREDLGLGPIELNDLLHNLAAEFDVTFNSEDIESLQRVEDLVVLVEDNLLE